MNLKNNQFNFTNSNTNPKNDSMEDIFGIQAVMAPEGNYAVADPFLVQHYQFLQDRKLFLFDEINEGTQMVIKQLLYWMMEDEKNNIPVEERKPIFLYLLSYGGDAAIALSLVDIMKLCKSKIYTINLGICASAAFLIWISGTKGCRYALKNSWGLCHQGSGGAQGTAEMVVSQTKNYQRILENIKNIVIENTNIDIKLYNRNKNKEWYVYPNQYVELGCCDYIVDNIDQIT